MDARFYNSEDIDIERLAQDLVNAYLAQGYQAQNIGTKDQQLVQLKKGGDFEALIGMQAALSLTIQRTGGGTLAMIGQQRWIDKAAVGTIGIVAMPILWPLALTAGVGALRQASLGNQVLNIVDGLARQQRPSVQIGPVPQQVMPHVQQQWAPPSTPPPYYTPPSAPQAQPAPTPAYNPAPAPTPVYSATPAPTKLRCSNCNTPYEPGDTFCTGCGHSLAPQRLYCPNCNYELKPGVAFCPKCGASTFSATSSAAQRSAPKPPPQPVQPGITYTQPTVPPQRPPTPVYTPSAQQTPVYTPPPKVDPYSAPTVASQPAPVPAKPVEPYYVPPVTQNPPVQPQPSITYTASATPKKEPAAAPPKPEVPYYVPPVTQNPPAQSQPKVSIVPAKPKEVPPPPKPEKVYYTPPAQPEVGQSVTIQAQAPLAATQPPTPVPAFEPTAASQSDVAAQSAPASTTPWGTLTFSDGQEIVLQGESATVGRADHDLGGSIQPEVDLSKTQGSDTVSRIHAVIEHLDGDIYTLTDLNSTNATRLNGKRLEPDKATPINDGDSLQFGKVTCTFKKS